ncbi:MAG: YggT family protein [Candidatus Izemoplasmatales bacterium]|jgi:YggT family protein
MLEFLYYAYLVLTAYFYIMIAYILLGWIPSVRSSRFYYYLSRIVDPYLGIFRGWFVFGGLDFTPMVGLLLYQFILSIISRAL